MPSLNFSRRTATDGPWRIAVAIAVALLCCLPASLVAQQTADESQLKAAFLFNFGKFVEWPEAAASAKEPLTICVAGDNGVAHSLSELTAGKAVNGKEVKVVLLHSLESNGNCQILFIGRSASKDKKTLLERVQNAPILTVGEEGNFTEQGGILTFLKEGSRIHFAVNQEAAARSGLKISSKLLALAQIVHSKE